MSTVRYFNDIPHIVRYGMQSDKDEKGWILFWRNGVQFTVHVQRNDIRGTPFEKSWLELSREPIADEGRTWVDRWDRLCDCIISQCKDTLDELAPAQPYWITLQDYLRTPCYKLEMVTDQVIGDARPQVTDSPKIKPAYEMEPISVSDLGVALPESLPRFDSNSLTIVDKEDNWRIPPHRVRALDGQLHSLLSTERSSKMVETGVVMNASLDKIRSYVRLLVQCQKLVGESYPKRIQRVVGYASTDVTGLPDDETNRPPASVAPAQDDPSSHTLIVGLLLTSFSKSKTLGELARLQKSDPALATCIRNKRTIWKAQTLAVVQELHAHAAYWGGRHDESWFHLNQHTILIDEQQDVWLDGNLSCSPAMMDEDPVTATTTSDAAFERGKLMDLKAIEGVFEEWLPAELSEA